MGNKTNPKAPPKGFMKVLCYFGMFIMIAFPVGMLFAGFATMDVSCTRNQAGQLPDCKIGEERLFGLLKHRATVTGVTGVDYKTGDVGTARRALACQVVLSGSNGTFSVTRAASSTGSGWKSEVIEKVGRFLNTPNEPALTLHFHERNIFGWMAVAYLAVFGLAFVFGYVPIFYSWVVRKLNGRS